MTDMADLMQKRMALVTKLAALNSKQLQNTQTRSGIEVELLTVNEIIEQNGETEATLLGQATLEARYQEAVAACAACERELDELAEQLNALDQAQAGPAS